MNRWCSWEAVLRLLRALSGEAGCLLVLEDLHWADRETLALLEYLADNSAAERVLYVGTLRDEEGAAAAGLASVLEARGSAVVLPLSRLDAAAADDGPGVRRSQPLAGCSPFTGRRTGGGSAVPCRGGLGRRDR